MQDIAGPAIAVEAADAAIDRIHGELHYSEKQSNTEITEGFGSLSYTTVYVFCLLIFYSSFDTARLDAVNLAALQ